MRPCPNLWVPWVLAAVLLLPGGVLGAPALTASPPVTASAAVSLSPSSSDGGGGYVPVTVAPAFVPPAGVEPLGPPAPASVLEVAVGLPLSDPAGLAAYLQAEYAAGSPTYRSYLTPGEVAARFGPSAKAVASTEAYFQGFGLSVSVLPNDLLLSVRGPSASVARAFSTTFEQYRNPSGRVFVSHPTAAVLPGSLGVSGAFGLGNATPLLPSVSMADGSAPSSGAASACGYGPTGAIAPCQIATAYDFASDLSSGTNGTGERIGVVDAYDGGEPETELSSDLAQFDCEFSGCLNGAVTYAYPVSTTADLNLSTVNPDWGLEEALDLEWARATAPGASITMTFSPDSGPGLLAAVDWLVATGSVNVISMSWGEPLTGVLNAYSGPCSSACNASTDGTLAILDPVLEVAAAEGISAFAATGDCGAADGTSGDAVNYPAADPWVTAVGGTALSIGTNGTWVSETGWSGNVTGATSPGCSNQGGSGGGYSPLPRPAWQVGLAASPSGRAIPDVALDAGEPVSVMYQGSFTGALGTSVATPIWAGIAALADQKAGAALGFLDPSLYRIYQSANYSSDFHDIKSGFNGYFAGTGWDPVTGIGTPIVAPLLSTLAGRTPSLSPPAVFVYASPRFGRAPLTVSFAVNVSGGTGSYAVEEVNFGDGNSSPARGVVNHTYESPGVYSAAAFVLDSSDNGSSSPPVAIVVGGGSALAVSLAASTQSPARGASVTFTLAATGGTGTVEYNVSFGDGTYSDNQTGPTVTHAYASDGGYCAEAVARDARDPPDGGASARVSVSVGGAPFPDCENDTVPVSITPNPSPQVRDAGVEFVNLFQVTGGTNGPDGLTGSLEVRAADPYVEACGCAIFRTPGNYSVTAWYNDTVDQGATAMTTVEVEPALSASFTVSQLAGGAPLTVYFNATVHGGYRANADATVWTLGNGSTEVGSSIEETFPSAGEYLVLGHLEDSGHGNASEAFLLDVLAPGPTIPYGICGTVSPATDLTSGTTVTFYASDVGPGGEPFLESEWDLGDGFGGFVGSFDAGLLNETYFGPLPTAEGNVLRVEVAAVLENTQVLANASFSLPSFFAVEPGGALPRSQALFLSSTLAPTEGPTPFTANALAEVSGPGTLATSWSFGDGATIPGANATHVYRTGGTFTATVAASDLLGDHAYESYAVYSNPGLEVLGGPNPSSGAPPLTVTYEVLGLGGNGPPYTYSWTFSNGSSATGASVVVTYTSAGVYHATVNVTDSKGASVRMTWTVTVTVPPAFGPSLLVGVAGAVGVAAGLAALLYKRKRKGGPGPPVGAVSP